MRAIAIESLASVFELHLHDFKIVAGNVSKPVGAIQIASLSAVALTLVASEALLSGDSFLTIFIVTHHEARLFSVAHSAGFTNHSDTNLTWVGEFVLNLLCDFAAEFFGFGI